MRSSDVGGALRSIAWQVVAFAERRPWLGWAAWLIVIMVALLRTHPRRFGAAFQYYLDSTVQFWSHQPLYDPTVIGGFPYWPPTVVAYSPLILFSPVAAAVVAQVVSVVLLSWGSIALMRELSRSNPDAPDPWMAAGFLLLINALAVWFNIKSVQAQIPMTGAMMIAAAAMMQARWTLAAFWLFVAVAIKPLALVMMLLCLALVPRMRVALIAAIVAALMLPLASGDVGYVIELYRTWALKMWRMSQVRPGEWPYQADFSIMLASLGIVLPSLAATAIRALAALGTLWLAFRFGRAPRGPAFVFGILLLAGCYLCLFGPRTEHVSFLVLTPGLAALALVLLARDRADPCAWLLILAALALGFDWPLGMTIDAVLKPAIVLVLYAWLAQLALEPERWRTLVVHGARSRESTAWQPAA